MRLSTSDARNRNFSRGALGHAAMQFTRHWILPTAIAAAVLFPLRSALADWYQVPSGSMRPTIVEGDRILVSNLAYGLRVPFSTRWMARWDGPRRGDIVTLASPADGVRLVKRIVGLPGDRISMEEDRLLLNGKPLAYDPESRPEESGSMPGSGRSDWTWVEHLPGRAHAIALTPAVPSRRSFQEILIPPGQYFVMGDNRDNSADSRYFGTVSLEKIYGRASHVVVSLDPGRFYLPRSGRWMKRLL